MQPNHVTQLKQGAKAPFSLENTMKLLFVTVCFMVALAVATCCALFITTVAVEHHAPHAFIIVMAAFTGLAAFMTVALPVAFHRAHSK